MIAKSCRLGIVGVALAAVTLVSTASGAGSRPTNTGGTARQQAQVRAALKASSFNWSVVRRAVSVRIKRGVVSHAIPGEIVLDADLLNAGTFSWGVIQHEFAHQVDFLLLDDADRARLQAILGSSSWWPSDGLAHDQLGCERFASTLAWAYWPSPASVMRPVSRSDKAGSVPPAAFRALLDSIVLAHEIASILRH